MQDEKKLADARGARMCRTDTYTDSVDAAGAWQAPFGVAPADAFHTRAQTYGSVHCARTKERMKLHAQKGGRMIKVCFCTSVDVCMYVSVWRGGSI